MAWVPLPWWTSQSTMSTRSPRAASAAAATAMLLSRQKPIGSAARAWCPGGRAATKATSPSPARQRLDDLEGGTGRQQCCVPRTRCCHRVGVERPAPGLAEGAQCLEVRHGVDEGQLLLRGPTRLERDDGVGQPCRFDAGQRGGYTSRSLGVPGAGVMMVESRGGGHQEHRFTVRLSQRWVRRR